MSSDRGVTVKVGQQFGEVLIVILASMSDITRILSKIEAGNQQASEKLLPLVYDELRSLAAARLAQEKPGQTLQATALVHDVWLRLVGDNDSGHWNSRGHFFGAAARAMRQILINRARNKQRQKRGGGSSRIELDKVQVALNTPSEELVALDEAMEMLEQHDEKAAKLVELRFFAGLTHGEAARAMGVTRRTADRYWAYARAWLHAELSDDKQ